MKKFIFCVLIVCFGFTCAAAAQDTGKKTDEQWKQLNSQTVKAYKEGRYQEGINFAEKAYQYALKQFGKEHPDTLISMNNLAGLYK